MKISISGLLRFNEFCCQFFQNGRQKSSFHCECGKTYPRYTSLWNHKRYRCGKQPQFSCSFCDHRTWHKCNLKTHVAAKHPEKVDSEIKEDIVSLEIEALKANVNAVPQFNLPPDDVFSTKQIFPKCPQFPTESFLLSSVNPQYSSNNTHILGNTSQLSLINKQIPSSMNLLSSANSQKMYKTPFSSLTLPQLPQSNRPCPLPSNIPPLPPGLTISFEKPPVTAPLSDSPPESFSVIPSATFLHSNLVNKLTFSEGSINTSQEKQKLFSSLMQ